jgi:hypothetical protein
MWRWIRIPGYFGQEAPFMSLFFADGGQPLLLLITAVDLILLFLNPRMPFGVSVDLV